MKLGLMSCCVGLLAGVLFGCGPMPQHPVPVTDATLPVMATGFSVLPPGPEGWLVTQDSSRNMVGFGTFAQAGARQMGTVMIGAMIVKSDGRDIRSLGSLNSAVIEALGAKVPRHTRVSEKFEPFQDAELNTDCVRVETVTEERSSPYYPAGKVLLITARGKVCRHALSPGYLVSVICSERRPNDVPPLMDETLAKECTHTVDSLKFLPIP